MKYIETQAELTADAQQRVFKPGTLALRISGSVVLLTSWPWFEGEGDERQAIIMARSDPNDPMTNGEIQYFTLMRRVGEQDL